MVSGILECIIFLDGLLRLSQQISKRESMTNEANCIGGILPTNTEYCRYSSADKYRQNLHSVPVRRTTTNFQRSIELVRVRAASPQNGSPSSKARQSTQLATGRKRVARGQEASRQGFFVDHGQGSHFVSLYSATRYPLSGMAKKNPVQK